MLSIREIQPSDINALVNYWHTATESYLAGMGADIKKLPSPEEFAQMLTKHINTPIEQRISCCIIWEINGKPAGHSNTNPTKYGEEAFMHLHLWHNEQRQKGLGAEFVKLTLPYYFNKLKLKKLYSEPYALNPAPNKTFEKLGFELVKEYITIPGYLNFQQPVKQWLMTRERFDKFYGNQ
jgi:RimJ/RimL family protein N-acetyltransferase